MRAAANRRRLVVEGGVAELNKATVGKPRGHKKHWRGVQLPLQDTLPAPRNTTSRIRAMRFRNPWVMVASQRSLHNAPIFRLLLKVAVKGTHQCDFLNFCGVYGPQRIGPVQDRHFSGVERRPLLTQEFTEQPTTPQCAVMGTRAYARNLQKHLKLCVG